MNFDVLVIKTEKNSSFWPSTFASLENQPITIRELTGGGLSPLENFLHWSDLCISEYISFVCDDDLVTEGAFEQCSLYLEQHPNVKALYTNSHYIDSIRNTSGDMYKKDMKWSINFHLTNAVAVHQLIIVKRELVVAAIDRLKQIPDYLDMLPYAVERPILWDLVATQTPWHYYPKVCYTWRRHGASISNTETPQQIQTRIHMREIGKDIFKNERRY